MASAFRVDRCSGGGVVAMVEKVSFQSSSPFLFRDAAPGGNMKAQKVEAHLYIPSGGSDRYPAVVVMEGLGGLKHSRECRYGRFLADYGYVTLVVDSFGSRNAPDTHNLRALTVTEAMMCADAYAALRYLRAHPRVDPGRVCVIGFSYGGMVSMLLAHAQIQRLMARGDERFSGHVAYYGCSVARLSEPVATGSPVLIVLGERDRNVSIERSRAIANDLRAGGAEVSLEVLENTYHQWDSDEADKKFVRFNLRHCYARLGPDNEMRDEATGIRIRGPVSRALLLMTRIDPKGYCIQRSETALRRSDSLLISFLESASDLAEQALPS